MSVGFFVRLAGYNRRYKGGLAKIGERAFPINSVLAQTSLPVPAYREPEIDPPGIYNHLRPLPLPWPCCARSQQPVKLCATWESSRTTSSKMLPLLRLRQPLYFLPIAFSAQLCFDLGDTYDHSRQPLCSSHQVSSKLAALAKYLNIPLNGARLSDEAEQAITMKITNCKLCGSRHSKLRGRAWRSTAHLFARDG
jgi:hypothetical protein